MMKWRWLSFDPKSDGFFGLSILGYRSSAFSFFTMCSNSDAVTHIKYEEWKIVCADLRSWKNSSSHVHSSSHSGKPVSETDWHKKWRSDAYQIRGMENRVRRFKKLKKTLPLTCTHHLTAANLSARQTGSKNDAVTHIKYEEWKIVCADLRSWKNSSSHVHCGCPILNIFGHNYSSRANWYVHTFHFHLLQIPCPNERQPGNFCSTPRT
jgi:hypothetical protein